MPVLRANLAYALVAALCLPTVRAETSPTSAMHSERATVLEAEIARIAAASDGAVGVAAWRLDGDGPRALVRADQRYPMASTFKIAVAGAVLERIDQRKLALDKMIAISPDAYVESDYIASRFIHAGISLSVHNLLEAMLTESDNTATDVLVAAAGGTQAVTDWVRRQGVTGLRIDRDTAGILRDFFSLPAGPFPAALAAARQADPKLDGRGLVPNLDFDHDPRDTATPEAMAILLARIFDGRALSAASTATLTAMMDRCRTGAARLRGLLPADTRVAHKTGTLGGSANDVGVMTLPGGDRIVVAVFIRGSAAPLAERERIIAEVGRAVRDYHLFTTAH